MSDCELVFSSCQKGLKDFKTIRSPPVWELRPKSIPPRNSPHAVSSSTNKFFSNLGRSIVYSCCWHLTQKFVLQRGRTRADVLALSLSPPNIIAFSKQIVAHVVIFPASASLMTDWWVICFKLAWVDNRVPKLAAVLTSDNAKDTPNSMIASKVQRSLLEVHRYKVFLDERSIIPKYQSFSAKLPYNLVIGSARMCKVNFLWTKCWRFKRAALYFDSNFIWGGVQNIPKTNHR